MTENTTPQTFKVDFDDDGDPEISHVVAVGNLKVRCLTEPNGWNVMKATTDYFTVLRAYVHPEDFDALDSWLSGRRRLPQGALTNLINAIVEKPTGHPTNGSAASPTF